MISILLAAAVSTLVSLLGTRYLIVFFQTRGQGQPILGKDDLGPEHHMAKQGTPTMGGLAIVIAAFLGWLVAHLRPNLPFATQSMIVWISASDNDPAGGMTTPFGWVPISDCTNRLVSGLPGTIVGPLAPVVSASV